MTREDRDDRQDAEVSPGGPRTEGGGPGQEDEWAGLTMEDLKQKLREAREEAREAREEAQRNWQHFLHSAADLENYKKLAARDRHEAVERTRRNMVSLILSVLDTLERALAYAGDDLAAHPLVEGLRMAQRQIVEQLRTLGVRPIDAVGHTFDPPLHEVVKSSAPTKQARQAAP